MRNKTIVSIDIQPEYAKTISFIDEWADFINVASECNNIVFFWNGPELGMVKEIDYQMWLTEIGIEESVLEHSRFHDKSYAFFRYCMDSGIDHTETVSVVKFMIANKVSDSRDIKHSQWDEYMRQHGSSVSEVRELLEFAGDSINTPDLLGQLQRYNNIVIMGGGRNECLKEVEIALMAIDKPYELMRKFIYG